MERHAIRVVGVVTALSVIIVIVLAFAFVPFGFPLMDELVQARSVGTVWSDISSYYFSYSGRWASIGLESIFLRGFDIVTAYPLMLSACLVTILVGFTFFFHTLLGKGSSWIASIGAGALLFSLMWVNMPLPSDGLYWFEADLEDPVSLSLGFMAIAGTAAAARMDAWTLRWGLAAAALAILTAVAGGMHEHTSSALLGTLTLFAVLAFWNRSNGRSLLTVLLIVALADWIVLLVAPGNTVRAHKFPHPEDIRYTLGILQVFLVRYFVRWIFDPRLILASLALLLHLDYLQGWRHWASSLTRLQRLLILLAFCGMMSGTLAAPMFLEGALPPDRLLLLQYLMFVCGWMAILVIYAVGAKNSVLLWLRKKWWAKATVWLAFSVLLLASSNVAIAVHELSGEAQGYKRDLLQRDTLLRRLSEHKVKAAVVTPLPWHLRVLPVVDVTADPKYANNRATAAFYGLKSIRTETRNVLSDWNLATPKGKKEWRTDSVSPTGCLIPSRGYADFINAGLSLDASKPVLFRLRVKCLLNKKESAIAPSKVRLYWASDEDIRKYVTSKVYPFIEARAASLVSLSRDGIEWSVDLRNRPMWTGTIGGLMLRVCVSHQAKTDAQDCIQVSVREMEILGAASPGQVIAWEDGDYR